MHAFFTYISTRIKAMGSWRAARYDKTILALELIYLRAMKVKTPSLTDAIAATRKIILAHLFTPELYVLVISIAMLVFFNDVFSAPDINYGWLRPFFHISGSIFAGILGMALAYITLPFHLLASLNLWLLTGVHALLSAAIFSTLQPMFARQFITEGVAGFEHLFLPMLIFYSVAEFFLLSRLNKKVSYLHYKARHRIPTIEQLIPADKSGPLVSMSAQDHYVEIVTQKGKHLERLTMKAAVELVPKDAGLQVHRSHWVAYAEIQALEKTGERYAVVLKCGTRLPVGKTRVAPLQAFLESR